METTNLGEKLLHQGRSPASPLTIDDCHEYVLNDVFRLRPVDYCKKYPKWPGQVGLEIEMLPVRAYGDGTARVIPLQVGDDSLATWLRRVAVDFGWQPHDLDEESRTRAPMLKNVIMEHGDQLSFEPGGRFEFSSVPYPCLSDAVRRLEDVQAKLRKSLAAEGVHLLQAGINPWQTVEDIGLQMTKPRYRAMDEYFQTVGEFGRRMMRQTCTVQVNLDFGPDEATMAKRFLLSNLVAPVATAIFANSPFWDGRNSGYASSRARIWRGVDDARTGFPQHLDGVAAKMTRESCVRSYIEYALNAPVVFVAGLNYRVPQPAVTLRDWVLHSIEGVYPTLEDFQTHLSLLFPEARARGFIELRSVDCQNQAWQSVPGAFYCGLLYDTQALDEAIAELLPLMPKLHWYLERSMHGLKDKSLADLSQRIFDISWAGFGRLSPCFHGEGIQKAFKVYGEHFVNRYRTPADDLLEDVATAELSAPNLAVMESLTDKWRQLI